jgi:hypothetical protein
MATIGHCQGCGMLEGQPLPQKKKGRRGKPAKEQTHPLVVLTPTILADYGEQLLCQDCREAVRKLNNRLALSHLTLAS